MAFRATGHALLQKVCLEDMGFADKPNFPQPFLLAKNRSRTLVVLEEHGW